MRRNRAEDLPSDVIVLIARRVGSYDAYFAFRRVCRSWRWATKNEKFNPNSSSPQLPWLMLLGRNDRDGSGIGKAYSLLIGEKMKMGKLAVPPREIASNPGCYFESQGWIFTTSETKIWHERGYCLWNLFSGAKISLPNAAYGSVRRAALHLKSGSVSDFEIMVFGLGHNQRWMFSRVGDTEWTNLWFEDERLYTCIKYHPKGQLYGSTPCGKVMVLHRQNPGLAYSEEIVSIPNLPKYWFHSSTIHNVDSYMVDLSADSLLAVWKHRGSGEFHIYEVDLIERSYKKVTELGDKALFLGHSCNTGALVKVAVAAPHSKIKANHIYYCVPLTRKIRVYNLRVKKTSRVYHRCGIFVTPPPYNN